MPYYLLLAVTCIAILLAVRVYKYKKRNELISLMYSNMLRRTSRILHEAQVAAQLRDGQVSGRAVYEALSDIVQGYEPETFTLVDTSQVTVGLKPGLANKSNGDVVIVTHVVRDVEFPGTFYAHVEGKGLMSAAQLKNVV